MISDLLLHPESRKSIEAFLSSPKHAVLLSAPAGAGKTTVAIGLAHGLLSDSEPKSLSNYPYFRHIAPVKAVIPISQIRELQTFLSLKTPGQSGIRRTVIIEDAHLMTTEAQNALLKTLEEPPADTVLILTAADTGKLLPTVRSRIQSITLFPPTPSATAAYFTTSDQSRLASNIALADGQIGLLSELLDNSSQHPLVTAIGEAKELLKLNSFQRLARVDAIAKTGDVAKLLDALRRILRAGLSTAAKRHDDASTHKFYGMLRQIERTEAARQRAANQKLLLSDLFLNL